MSFHKNFECQCVQPQKIKVDMFSCNAWVKINVLNQPSSTVVESWIALLLHCLQVYQLFCAFLTIIQPSQQADVHLFLSYVFTSQQNIRYREINKIAFPHKVSFFFKCLNTEDEERHPLTHLGTAALSAELIYCELRWYLD